MAFRDRWRHVQALDRALIGMVILAGISLFGIYLRSVSLPAARTASVVEREAVHEAQGVPTQVPAGSPGRRVLVIMNLNSPESMHIGVYYAKKRIVPRANLVLLTAPVTEQIDRPTYTKTILTPIRAALAASKNPVDFMLFTRGVPIRIADNGTSVDGDVATDTISYKTTAHPTDTTPFNFIDNPYFNKHEHFTRAKYGFCLACRLDGYTEADAEAMVDRSMEAKPLKGPFLLDGTPSKSQQGYGDLNKDLGVAAMLLHAKGFVVKYDPGPDFISLDTPLAGYCSWGSNDANFSAATYHKLTFAPGAICETFVSTSARTFRPTQGGQSLIADLIQQGVTGVKGYVDEPYTFALARPSLLFDRYTSGFNLAESFYMASPVIRWKEVVIGDPLCSPYKQ
ncbi:MAG: TIGR03790 family protein [Fimbriimonadaceae bacterium]